MKKSNVIIFAILAVVSIFLLWLWYYLGFNKVDSPLDLVLSIVWWVVIAIAIIAIVRIEKARRQRIRTIYVSDGQVFNSEAGIIAYQGVDQLMATMEGILANLKYDFTKNDLPDTAAFPVKYFVRSDSFGNDTWEGDVVTVGTKQEAEFEDKAGLYNIIIQL